MCSPGRGPRGADEVPDRADRVVPPQPDPAELVHRPAVRRVERRARAPGGPRAAARSPRASATLPDRKCTSGSFGASLPRLGRRGRGEGGLAGRQRRLRDAHVGLPVRRARAVATPRPRAAPRRGCRGASARWRPAGAATPRSARSPRPGWRPRPPRRTGRRRGARGRTGTRPGRCQARRRPGGRAASRPRRSARGRAWWRPAPAPASAPSSRRSVTSDQPSLAQVCH